MEKKSLTRVVGLSYSPDIGLPVVSVKGAGPIADELLKNTLKGSGPRLVRDAQLLDQLYRLPIDSTIDPALFQVVAAVLAHVFAVNEKLKGIPNV